MGRLTYDQLNIIKDKFGVDKLWSFSKVSTFTQCSWLYKLKYVDKIPVKGDNCYTWWGTVGHDLVQGLYDGEHTYGQMIEKLEDKVVEYNVLIIENPKLKFPNDSEYEHYIANLRHYFTNVKMIPYKVFNEKPVLAKFDGIEQYVFQGYIDSTYEDDEGNTIILDYKTSSMSGFSGAKLLEKSRQLMIYAMGLNMFLKIPLERIKIRYDMMKYVNVSYVQKNGSVKVTKAERRLWVGKIANPLRKDLEDVSKAIEALNKEYAKLEKKHNAKIRTEEEKIELKEQMDQVTAKVEELNKFVFDAIEINEMIEEAISMNSLSNMPEFIQDKYTITDCYIDVELTSEIMDEFKSELIATLDKIIEKESEEDKDEAFNRSRIENADSYYCTNLCDMNDHCKFYQEYKEHNAMFLSKKEEAPSDEELLAMLGL